MKVKAIAKTMPNNNEDVMTFCGKIANTCYMKGDLDSVLNQPKENAINRANNCLSSGHHSVFDHCNIVLGVEGAPKALVMILNGFNLYGASEKSARYCVFKGLNEEDQKLYDKWTEKLCKKIKENEPDLTDAALLRKAGENARYMVSIFSPCTDIVYSTNVRQLSYIIQRLENLLSMSRSVEFTLKCSKREKQFLNLLDAPLEDFINKVKENITVSLNDERINLFYPLSFFQRECDMSETLLKDFNICFEVNRKASYACVAQLERSRTLKYSFNILSEFLPYVPKNISLTDEEINEWCNDMKKVQHLFPQGEIVNFIVRGGIDDFFKYQFIERSCSRAFDETNKIVMDMADEIYNNMIPSSFKEYIKETYYNTNMLYSKCCIIGCKSPCGKNKSLY